MGTSYPWVLTERLKHPNRYKSHPDYVPKGVACKACGYSPLKKPRRKCPACCRELVWDEPAA